MRADQKLSHFLGPLELIHEQAGPRLLLLVQRGIVGLWIFKLLLDPLWRLAELPRELFEPTGVLRLFGPGLLDWQLSAAGLTSLWAGSLLFLGLTLFFTRPPLALTISAFLLTVYSSLIRSYGPAVHTDIPLLLAVYALAGFAWADVIAPAQSPADKAARASYPLITIVAMLCLSYCMVGLARAILGGIHVFTGDLMEMWAVDASLRGYYFNTNVGWQIPHWPLVVLMLKGGLPAVTVFEIMAPLCLVWARFRWVFIPFMLSFHLLSLVFMNIFFFDDMFLYLLLIDWAKRFPGLRG
jgi:hypothetical protein